LPCIRTAAKRLCEKEPKLWDVDLSVIFPTSPKRVITLLSLLLLALSQRDRAECFQIWDLVLSRSDEANSQIKWKRSLTAAPRAVEVCEL